MSNDLLYEPGEDSYLIGGYLGEFSGLKVLDMGAGSGYLAEIAKRNNCIVTAADINKRSVEFCKSKGIESLESDLFSNIYDKYDLIVFNPPYLPMDDDEPADSRLITTGGIEGFELIERFLLDAKKFLRKDGIILLVFSSLTGNMVKLFTKYRYRYRKVDEEKLFFERLYLYELKL